MQAYSDADREDDPMALPDLEVFRASVIDCPTCAERYQYEPAGGVTVPDKCSACGESMKDEPIQSGWFYWYCFPGCLPDSEPYGPFESKEDALAEAREGIE
jgi:hypothetical protein